MGIMKSNLLTLFALGIIISSQLITVNCQDEITTSSGCSTCLSTSTNFICKDNTVDTRSYCCASTSTTDRACQRDVCSNNLQTTSMRLYTCPYEVKACGGSDPDQIVQLGKNYSIVTGSKFVQYSICYWTLKASDLTAKTSLNSNASKISVTINTMTNTYLYLNNGTSALKAANETSVSFYSGYQFTFNSDQTVYILAVAYDTSPSLNISYTYKWVDLTCNGTYYALNGIRYCNYSQPNITYITNTTIIYVKEQTIEAKPQIAIYTLLGLIVIGIVLYQIVIVIEGKKKLKKKPPKVTATDLTDYELAPIEKQNLDYEEAVMYFNTARNSQINQNSYIHSDYNKNLNESTHALEMPTKQDQRFKVQTILARNMGGEQQTTGGRTQRGGYILNQNAPDSIGFSLDPYSGSHQNSTMIRHDNGPNDEFQQSIAVLPLISTKTQNHLLQPQTVYQSAVNLNANIGRRQINVENGGESRKSMEWNTPQNIGNKPQARMILANAVGDSTGKFTQMMDKILHQSPAVSNRVGDDLSLQSSTGFAGRQQYLKEQMDKYENKKIKKKNSQMRRIDSVKGGGYKSNFKSLDYSYQSESNSHRKLQDDQLNTVNQQQLDHEAVARGLKGLHQ
eukprot:403332654